jgi:hypothetical protein
MRARRKAGLPALAGSPALGQQGATIGIVAKGSKPGILLNAGVAMAIGLKLDPQSCGWPRFSS